MSRALSLVAILALASPLASCGGAESDLLGEGSVQKCLADHELGAEPKGEGPGAPPVYLNSAPDFSAYTRAGTRVDVVVQGTESKAEGAAADVRGAMLPLGIRDADQRVVADRNVVAVFADSPSPAEREAVSACLS